MSRTKDTVFFGMVGTVVLTKAAGFLLASTADSSEEVSLSDWHPPSIPVAEVAAREADRDGNVALLVAGADSV